MKAQVVTIELPQAARMMTRVEVDKTRRRLRVGFADGRVATVPVAEIEQAGRPVRLDLDRVELPDPYVILIPNSEGGTEEVPWDLVRHYADAEFTRLEQEQDELSRRALGEQLRRLREGSSLTQAELGKRAGVGRVTVARIENGRRYARTETLRRLARSLGVPLVELLAPETE